MLQTPQRLARIVAQLVPHTSSSSLLSYRCAVFSTSARSQVSLPAAVDARAPLNHGVCARTRAPSRVRAVPVSLNYATTTPPPLCDNTRSSARVFPPRSRSNPRPLPRMLASPRATSTAAVPRTRRSLELASLTSIYATSDASSAAPSSPISLSWRTSNPEGPSSPPSSSPSSSSSNTPPPTQPPPPPSPILAAALAHSYRAACFHSVPRSFLEDLAKQLELESVLPAGVSIASVLDHIQPRTEAVYAIELSSLSPDLSSTALAAAQGTQQSRFQSRVCSCSYWSVHQATFDWLRWCWLPTRLSMPTSMTLRC